MPYRWQVQEGGQWKALPDNETIEKEYCDPSNTYRYSALTATNLLLNCHRKEKNELLLFGLIQVSWQIIFFKCVTRSYKIIVPWYFSLKWSLYQHVTSLGELNLSWCHELQIKVLVVSASCPVWNSYLEERNKVVLQLTCCVDYWLAKSFLLANSWQHVTSY